MPLETYRRKRQFDITPEPRGRQGRRGGHRYVIQKHAARRLHYDLRLELDGVMKSWAVTRGPSLDPGEKRLAVHVEDHPIAYNSFEGIIPQGEYGAGTVMIWDRGRWRPEGDPHQGYAKGHLVFDLEGEKLRGRWHLVRMGGRGSDRHDNWLLIKGKDEEARRPRDPDILDEQPRSVATGRSIEEIAAGNGGARRVWHSDRPANSAKPSGKAQFRQKISKIAARPLARATAKEKAGAGAGDGEEARKRGAKARRSPAPPAAASLPDFVAFSLATPADKAPSGPGWIHEIKFDGYRLEARLDHGRVQLLTRKRQDWTRRFPPLAAALAALPAATALLDGEVVVEDARGISDFSLLQSALKDGGDRFVYYLFDLLHLDGRDFTAEPLLVRKAALARLLRDVDQTAGPLRYTEHVETGGGPLVLKKACEIGLEGIISKRRDAPYSCGRTDNFVKTKCRERQEFVVAGYVPAAASPGAVGALIVAVHVEGELRYAGRVGTGYTQKTARELSRRLADLRRARPPLKLPADERRRDVVWVKPELVVEAEFAGFTHGGVLRQASFKGIREDKAAKDVVRELPVAEGSRQAAAAIAAKRRSENRSGSAAQSPAAAQASRTSNSNDVEVAHVRLTHPQRVYWPAAGVTKQDLAEYYVTVWNWMQPHVAGRALALVRGPEGIAGETFFQKHIAGNIKSSPLRHAVAGKDHDVIAVESLDDLIELVQSAALEIHVRGSRLASLETCDRIVFDLDPGEGVGWPQVVAAAREARARLAAERLESFVKLTGGKGLHVVAPIADAGWEAVRQFTRRVALAMAADSPKLYVAKMAKALRQGRIFIDYFRNTREATSIAPYSTRARPGAPVAAPVAWERLSRTAGGNDFSVRDLARRLKEDAWAEIGKVRQKLPPGRPVARRPRP